MISAPPSPRLGPDRLSYSFAPSPTPPEEPKEWEWIAGEDIPWREHAWKIDQSLLQQTVHYLQALFGSRRIRLDRVSDAISRSRDLIGSISDDEPDTVPVSERTWKRAIELFSDVVFAAASRGAAIEIPKILGCPDGSIDLHWKTPRYELLVNVPADDHVPAQFYCDNGAGQWLKGTLTPGSASLLASIQR